MGAVIIGKGAAHVETVWMVLVLDEGVEGLVSAQSTTGQTVPLIAFDRARLDTIIEGARIVARSTGQRLRVAEFTTRQDIAEIGP